MFKEVTLKEAVNAVIGLKNAYKIESGDLRFYDIKFLTLNEIMKDKDTARFIVDVPEEET